MNPNELGVYGAFAAILAMAAATHFIRLAGYWTMGRVPLTPRVRRMLDALPGSVVVATVVPIVAQSGGAAMLGIGLVVGLMMLCRNEFLAVLAGLGAVALARAVGM
jgi:uncharacterized membrane protein